MDARSKDTRGAQALLSLVEAATPPAARARPVAVVDTGDLKVSANPHEVLAAHGIGSGLCVLIHDPEARVGGLLHFLLPSCDVDPERCAREPGMFGDTGVRRLLEMMVEHQAMRGRLRACLVGGADPRPEGGGLPALALGSRNVAIAEQLLAAAGLRLGGTHCGGTAFRSVLLDVGSGAVTVGSPLLPEVRL